MGINSISEQKSNIDFQTNNVQNNNSRYYIKSNGADKTPQSDTVQISNKKDTVKKVAIGAAIVGTAVGLFYLLRGKKPPKKVMEQVADTIADTKPKMEITEEAKKIYDDVASKFHKKTRVTSETIEQNIKPKEKAGSWSSDDMKEFYTKLEKESDAKIAAEKAAKEAEEKAAKLAAEKAAKEQHLDLSIAHYDMRFLKPMDTRILHEVGSQFDRIITIEDGVLTGGLGSAVVEYMNEHGFKPQIVRMGLPDSFVEHGTVKELYQLCGIDEEHIVATINACCGIGTN